YLWSPGFSLRRHVVHSRVDHDSESSHVTYTADLALAHIRWWRGLSWLSEEDAVAEWVEAGSAVHLSHDPLGFGVDTFGSAVVVGQGQAGVDGVAVLSKPAGEGV